MKDLRQTVRQLVAKEVSLRQKAQSAQDEQARISGDIAEVDRLLSRKDEMLATLHDAQVEAQAKSKGMFEELLSSLVNEVMPHVADKVVFTSTIYQNKPSLDIDIEVDGELENVAEDQGGSIANIIAMGLRFIVLARHPNRRVLLLDEADCHLREEYIPAFAAVMGQLATKMGIQVLYISHHNPSHFMGYARVLELYREGRVTHARILAEESPQPEGYEPPETALRYVRLKHFGRLQNALIELSPGLNVITGDNNLGKSKLLQAITELSVNNAKERRITHKKPSFEVEIGIEEGMSIHWSYKRSGKEKTLIELRNEQGVAVHSSTDGKGGAPDWLNTYLAMSPVNGQNIHYHSQKLPNYLLGDEFTSIERAKMLPLGRESRDVMQMNKLFNADVAAATQDRTRLLRDLNKQDNLVAAMSLILENQIDLIALQEECDRLLSFRQDMVEMKELIDRLEHLKLLEEMYLTGLDTLEREVVIPVELKPTSELAAIIERLECLRATAAALEPVCNIPPAVPEPTLHDLSKITDIGKRLKVLRALEKELSRVDELPEAIPAELKDHSDLLKAIESLETLKARIARGENLIKGAEDELLAIAAEKKAVIDELGGICPTCDQSMGDHSHD
ncbi:AAA family ATPase [Pseudomonas sp. PLMAX]|uniref:AAA family ATPase n=1 Tax=Pseudomonas sp. PLMAX TaxID=2201998 RepID=UPI0038B763F9